MNIHELKDKLSQYERAIKSRKKDIRETQDIITRYERIAGELREQIRKIETGQEELFQ